MSSHQTSPYEWAKQIPLSLLEKDNTPLLGEGPSLAWEKLAAQLKSVFQLKELELEISIPEWREEKFALKPLRGELSPLHFQISSLEGTGCWLMPKKEINALIGIALKRKKPFDSSEHPEFSAAFHQFFALQTIQLLPATGFPSSLVVQPMEQEGLPQGDALCIDVIYTVEGKRFKGILLITPELQRSWKEFHQSRARSSSTLAEKIPVTIRLEGGKITLSQKEAKQMKQGDLLILDSCTVDPDLSKGEVTITVQGIPILRGTLKKGSLTILENPLYHEVNDTMDETPDEDSEFETDFEEEEIEEEEEQKLKEEKEKPVVQKRSTKGSASVDTAQIPLHVIVEIARIQMPMKQLSELQPGNLLELNVKPEDGVDLVVNGKKVGRAELVKVGDSVGARILEIG